MNIAFLLTPKSQVAYIYEDSTFRQALEKLRHHGYSAVPVLTRDGKYAGTLSEGDFLWSMLEIGGGLSRGGLRFSLHHGSPHGDEARPGGDSRGTGDDSRH